MKKITILGSTGSIGTQTLDVVDNINAKVLGLTANNNIDLLEQQVNKYNPEFVAVMDPQKAKELRSRLGRKVEVLEGIDGIIEVAKNKDADIMLNSLVGDVGLRPTVEAIKNGIDIALANKETLVTAGQYIMDLVAKNNVKILPVDSEHSAIFQCLQGSKEKELRKILLTASGGPFRTKTYDELQNVTLEQALKHPNWSMGRKITIDSATLANKGLEVIEAKWLFDVSPKQIEVVVHPQSIVHSMVEFCDCSIIAQLGEPDMRVPIQYAITYPDRVHSTFENTNFFGKTLTFEEPNLNNFKALQYAYDCLEMGGLMPSVFNSANEVAVHHFLNNEIKFLDISKIISNTINAYTNKNIANYTIEDVFECDKLAREIAYNEVKKCVYK